MASSPVAVPLGPPTVSGTLITVDEALRQPNIITRDIARLAQQQFFADRVFSNAGDVQGGAVLVELPNPIATDLYAERGVQEVAPGEEFPNMTFLRGVPIVVKPRKIGGQWYVTKEAVKRNDVRLMANAMTQTANTIALTLDSMAVAVLQAAISANSRTFSTTQSWATAAGVTYLNRSGTNQALSDLLAAVTSINLEQRGHILNSALIHPNQNLSLQQEYGPSGIGEALASAGITNYFVSPRVTAGTVILYEEGAVGGWATEFPLTEEVEYERKTQRTWYQWSVSPVMYVDDPYALLQLTGVA
jgi:hypothetical protein